MSERMRYIGRLFRSTKGLLLVVTGWDAFIIASLSMFSGPMESLDLPGRLGRTLDKAERVGHTLCSTTLWPFPFAALKRRRD